jgi:hypothetical protein
VVRYGGGAWLEHEEVLGVGDHPGARRALGRHQVVDQPAAGARVVGARVLPPVGEAGRGDVEGDDLAVRVLQGRAGGGAVVAERHDGARVALGAQRAAAVAQHPEHGEDVVGLSALQVPAVVRRLDDHLVLAGGREGVARHAVRTVAVGGDQRVLVGHDPDLPTGRLGRAGRIALPLRRGEVLVARAERADRRGGRLGRAGVVGPRRPPWRDQPPVACLRVDPGLDPRFRRRHALMIHPPSWKVGLPGAL